MRLIRTLLVLLAVSICQMGFSQVRGISYTIAPSYEHVLWNDLAGLENGGLIGGRLGFGFGEFFELRGVYMQSSKLKTNFEEFGLENFDKESFSTAEVELKRIGGEMKANLGRGKLLPFLTLGTGIQELQRNKAALRKQIYLSAGAGIKIGVGDRMTLLLEAKNTAYRYNTGRDLLTDANKNELGLSDFDFKRENITNWSGVASLQFYLGGRKPGKMSDLDKAYFDAFNGGEGGLDMGLEAMVGKINFDDRLAYKDSWMGGGSVGFDIGPFIGVRGFYWRAMEDGELSTKFDDFAMYGGEMRMQLSSGTGFSPFLLLGGGKMDITADGYEGNAISASDTLSVTLTKEDDTGFAMGGAGMLIPLGKNFKIFGSARAILTSSPAIENLEDPEEITTSWLWSAGFKLRFGKGRKNPEDIMESRITSALQVQQDENDKRADQMKLEYEEKLVKLESELMDAYADQDMEKVEIIKEEKEQTELIVEELETRKDEPIRKESQNSSMRMDQQLQNAQPYAGKNTIIRSSNSVIQMSPAEFENLIEEILESTNPNLFGMTEQTYFPQTAPVQTENSQALLLRIQALENQVKEKEEGQTVTAPELEKQDELPMESEKRTKKETKSDKELLKLMYKLEEKLDDNNSEIKKLNERIENLETGKTKTKISEEEVKNFKLFNRKDKKKKNKE